jgi:branched-chain amino acid transport system substrate-binding protein
VIEHDNYWARLKRRRFLGVAGMGAGAAAFLAACGGGGEEKKETKATQAPAGGAATQAAAAATQAPAAKQLSAVKVGGFCDRSGATANVGNFLCEGVKDWNDYANANNIYGRKIEWVEFDHTYQVDKAEQGYKKFVEQDKVIAVSSYGTPITNALTPKAVDDKIPLFTPGYGISEVENGTKYPYTFVGVASYFSQAMALLGHLKDSWKDTSRKPKLIYQYYDNAAGQDPLELIKAQAPKLGFDLLTTVAVPATATDLSQQMLDAKQRDPDYIITHFFGAIPALSLKAAQQVGFPASKLYSMVWGIGDSDLDVAGPAASEGYHGLQFVAVKDDQPEAFKLIQDHYKKQNKTLDDKKVGALGVYYLRGVFIAILINECIRLAGDKDKITGEDVKKGAESMKEFKAFGMSPGTTLTAADHAGSRKVRLYQVKGGKMTVEKDWFEGPKPS